MISRRRFLEGLGLGVLATPCPGHAQPAGKIPRVGIVWISSRSEVTRLHGAFLRGLREAGYVEGRNIVVEFRSADGNVDRLPTMVAELLGRNVDVIVAPSTPAARTAKAATTSVPIVIANVADPESDGLVASLARPGGNLTGLSNLSIEFSGKYLELLKEALPGLSRVAVLWDSSTANLYRKRLESAASVLGLKLHFIDVRTLEEVEDAHRLAARSGDRAVLLVGSGQTAALMSASRQRIVDAGLKYRLPTMHGAAIWVEAGGLMSYGPDILDIFRRAAFYVDKILKGAKPADLPVEQPTKFELVVNLKTAQALGVTIPQSLLLRADQVIQ